MIKICLEPKGSVEKRTDPFFIHLLLPDILGWKNIHDIRNLWKKTKFAIMIKISSYDKNRISGFGSAIGAETG